jgi:hypothetical protein
MHRMHLSEFVLTTIMNSDLTLPNLHKFASPGTLALPVVAEPLTICGDILRAAHTETERVAADRLASVSGPKLNLEAMLGVISYCYAKGVVSSREIEEHLWRNAAFLRAFGEDLPTAQAIRRFRRQHREAILATIESALQHFWSRRSEPSLDTGTTGETPRNAFSSPHAQAQQLVDAAMLMDGLELE